MLNAYPLHEPDDFSYLFTSGKGITYHVYFLDYSYMFTAYPHLAKNVYSFNIDVIDGDISLTGEDERIGLTIVDVFKIFFSRRKNITVYVCDSADERHWPERGSSISGSGNITMVLSLKKTAWLW